MDNKSKENNMTKTASAVMGSETNEADKTKGTKKGKKTKADNNKQPELPESITCNGANKYLQNRMQRCSVVTGVKPGIAQSVPKSQKLDINFSQARKQKTLLGIAKAVNNQLW